MLIIFSVRLYLIHNFTFRFISIIFILYPVKSSLLFQCCLIVFPYLEITPAVQLCCVVVLLYRCYYIWNIYGNNFLKLLQLKLIATDENNLTLTLSVLAVITSPPTYPHQQHNILSQLSSMHTPQTHLKINSTVLPCPCPAFLFLIVGIFISICICICFKWHCLYPSSCIQFGNRILYRYEWF